MDTLVPKLLYRAIHTIESFVEQGGSGFGLLVQNACILETLAAIAMANHQIFHGGKGNPYMAGLEKRVREMVGKFQAVGI